MSLIDNEPSPVTRGTHSIPKTNDMRKLLLFLLLFVLTQNCFSQESTIKKWMSAIVNIEVRRDIDHNLYIKLIDDYMAGKITRTELKDIINQISLNPRNNGSSIGTAIYMMYKGKHLLVTARHMIYDEKTKKVFDKILIIQDSSEQINQEGEAVIMNLNMPGRNMPTSYLLSSKEEDLAVIVLEETVRNKFFINALEKRNYKPISIEDIDEDCKLKKGQEIMSFGYPSEISNRTIKPLTTTQFHWESPLKSIPAFSIGHVAESADSTIFFYGNIFVTHGNSGGPIISKNKLVGIVHGAFNPNTEQPIVKELKNARVKQYIKANPTFIKSTILIKLLNQLNLK